MPPASDPVNETYQSQDTVSEVISQGYGDPNAGEAGLSAWETNTVAAAPPTSPEEVPQNQPSSPSPSGDLGAPSLDEVRTIEANTQQAQAAEAIVPPDIGMVVGSVGVGTMPLIGLGEGAIAAGALIGAVGAGMLGVGIGLYLTHLPPAMPIEAGHEPVPAPAPSAVSTPIPDATPTPQIHGNPQNTGNPTHSGEINRVIEEAQQDSSVTDIYLNRSLSTVTDHEVTDRRRPDVTIAREDGSLELVEVVSPSQTRSQMQDKLNEMSDILEQAGIPVVRRPAIDPDYP